ncbi:extracellular solute-binding protein [Paenibacillus sp. MMS20-IR301]|uniref:ABC transporter substrate-binding protein n=1 Tax=Paenibacillus sp. MMS20-IR301 TaxID=2895946 RepID=UPI0028E7A936|nr:extracellular solute-binding protein [Paenibacillus sp. MMS20-IR301]WNS40814.1 extracellular solute-binding protein [Paenibacillus sp. MMS20-IR301]
MSRKSEFQCFVMLITITLLLSSCGWISQPASPSPTPKTMILFLSANKEGEGSAQIISELTKEYQEEHPEIEYKFEYVAESNLTQRIQLLAASNDLPILFNYQSGKPLQDLIQSNAVLDVEKTFKALNMYDLLNPTAVQLLKANVSEKGLYALPLEMNIEGFWYNKSIFARYGLKVPETWDELLEISNVLKLKSIQPFAVAGKEKWPITRLINAYIIRKFGVDAMDKVDRGELLLTDSKVVEGVEIVKEMGLKGYFGSNVNTIDMDTSVDMFLNGQTAMFYMGSWQLRAFNDENRNKIGADQIGFFSIPMVNGGIGKLDEYPVNAGLTTSFSKNGFTPETGNWMKYVFSRYGERAISDLGMVTGFNVSDVSQNLPELTLMVQEKLYEAKKGALWFEARFTPKAQMVAWNNAQLLITNPHFSALDYVTQLQEQIDKDRNEQ